MCIRDRLGPNRENPSEANVPIQQEKMFAAFTDYVNFNHIVGVSNVGELNKAVMEGQDAMLINVSEALHNNRIASIADDIKRKFMAGGARIVKMCIRDRPYWTAMWSIWTHWA